MPMLSTDWETRDERLAIFASRSGPEAEVQPATDGQLYLTGAKLSAWKGSDLPTNDAVVLLYTPAIESCDSQRLWGIK